MWRRSYYRLYQGYLERLTWPVVDTPGGVKPSMLKLIAASEMSLRFYNSKVWLESWQTPQAIPLAIHMTLRTPSFAKSNESGC
ncbi:type II secretion system protein GspJ [Yersinia entomophaga]|uniref:type II secretion system protein GspJ n=1 Tax=Yersinia entomophaga TaxID=935293 RepID=UPI000A016D3A|nr:type II secretion system protein GspJ [Yersinia entomophaga]OWF89628.1 hypothetical protein B4914_01865 [Yersinia entomophaga]